MTTDLEHRLAPDLLIHYAMLSIPTTTSAIGTT